MKTILKKLVILGNVAVFIFLVWLGFAENVLDDGAWSVLFFFAILVLIVANVYLIFSIKEADDWLSLFFKRKALEEKRKIADLENKAN